jgi:phage shock protein A
MGRFFRRLWKYFGASANRKLDEKADPRVQIEQAVEDAQKRHQSLTQQAAAVIGNQRQIEMKLARAAEDVGRLQASARQALMLSDQAKAAGDADKATDYEQSATTFASQLVSAEASMKDLQTLHGQAEQASTAARSAVEQNARQLQKFLGERSKLLTQLEAAKMQETVARQLQTVGELAAPGDVPTLTEVRDKIEQRYATAMGQAELAHDSVEGRMVEVERASIDAAATARLDQIRASIPGGDTATAQIAGSPAAAMPETAPPAEAPPATS